MVFDSETGEMVTRAEWNRKQAASEAVNQPIAEDDEEDEDDENKN